MRRTTVEFPLAALLLNGAHVVLYAGVVLAFVEWWWSGAFGTKGFSDPFRNVGILPLALAVAWAVLQRIGLAAHQLASLNLRPAKSLVESGERDFALILRPFGGDGSVTVRSHRWVLSPHVPLEDIVEESIRRELGCNSYALVDPSAGVLAAGPQYVLSDNDSWKAHVDALLKRSRIVLLYLPPSIEVRASVRWELHRLSELDYRGGVILVLPPPRFSGYPTARNAMRSALAILAPGVLDSVAFPILACVNYSGKVLCWYPKNPRWCNGAYYRLGLQLMVNECLRFERERHTAGAPVAAPTKRPIRLDEWRKKTEQRHKNS